MLMTYGTWKYSVQAQKKTRFPANENTHELDYGIILNLCDVPNVPLAVYDIFTHTHAHTNTQKNQTDNE